ncbi:glycosyltransferase family 2 protein [Flavobacterium sp. RSP15]|uniref:glycosyltransferase family 2 protein n=1 Tax=Flavobacterium sp. RSP15 TaxID=2497485 RepID=UPI000F821697|nr:glycosyltransferase family 2 protein [Flavobacterium sp. RSP15]RTY85570.1 glycosyltransferase family 2 protein [Flavobacterium sp. RSP15]
MSSVPKVTIIIATYNRAPFILEMLQSLQKQTFLDWEALIIDDGCTDNTLEVIAPILQQEERFRYYLRSQFYIKGTSGCRNYGLDMAKGDYIIFFDDDDIAQPQNLELCVIELSKADISFCRYIRTTFFGDFDYSFDYSKEYVSFYIDVNDIEKVLKYELPFNSCAVMWKKKCFENSRFNEKISYADEWEHYTRILSHGIKGISIEKCLFYGRKHPNSITGEFSRNNLTRKASYYEAILLVIGNLKEKKLLSYSLIRYFVTMSLGFKEYDLFCEILNILDLSQYEKLKWRLFYVLLPLRLTVFKLKKRIIKK